MYQSKLRRDYSAQTTITIGKVVDKGAFMGKTRRSHSEWFCWVEYQFSPPGGAAHKGWAMWSDACDLKRDGPVPVQYVVGNPDTNRPPGAEPPVPTFLLWFAAGVMVVIGMIRRGSSTET
jgi:hypothetical protein